MTPTNEQQAAADAFHAGEHLALQAGAGTGKTTTLAELAHATRRRGRYLAYNRAIAQDARSRFPATVSCKTAHALAYAAVGHRYTRRLNAPLRLTGTETVPTEIGPVTRPDAVLCRTNVGAMAQVMELLATRYRVALAGGGDSLRALALAARDLKEGRRTTHPELVLFPSWGELQDYAAHDPAGRDLQPLVDLVDTHGTDAILSAVAQLVPEQQAEVTVSTAHKAKGREWARVKIADDFTPPKDSDQLDEAGRAVPGPIDNGEARLAYVAVTRTRSRLDIGGLAWIDDPPTAPLPPSPRARDGHT
ncbi:3'-5' exonuclease [Streptomyces sp. NPDC097610]|uniref:3'-5' exonuclease n=1 Tax=Streptomyces sp. NPDC097610 TaxID=3157227 RepID=UPI0033189E46